ncbi:MAG TPA: NADH-quinone oxidoreductase subunit NuoF, partial [Dehalococcoidales bacterium]|nr:NADH-quinone oxidoreductase subunit NuoF [Dehalococcoidales bacterium]
IEKTHNCGAAGMRKHTAQKRYVVRVGMASCGIAAGSRKIYDAFSAAVASSSNQVQLVRTGCIGMCYNEPLVEIVNPDGESTFYTQVNLEQAERIINDHILEGQAITDWAVNREEWDSHMGRQTRIVLRNCGTIDPESINDYIDSGGYEGLRKALTGLTPQAVIDEVTRSGLRGRGGAGFPTGTKWNLARKSPGSIKYIVCNADEGDPGAFMNRTVLESDPHSVLEGMVIAGYAIGASHGFIYCRAEYPLAIKRLELTMAKAKEAGFLGENILGSGYDLDIKIREGAGAFVCGEETALMLSIEGKRGMPRTRPPFPAESGLWGQPTNINNVETYAVVPWILRHGGDKYAVYGTEKSKGTRTLALAGKIARSGLVEVPLGTSIREIVEGIGGGTSSGLPFKAVQIGGPSGGVIPASMADTTVDYESIPPTGAIMGSGGLITMDTSSCMVDIAKYFLNFTQDESCGKCTFCRIGTFRMLEILERITKGEGRLTDIEALETLAQSIRKNSLCGLGQSAPNPVLTTIKYFRDEYVAHIVDKHCPAHKCRDLITYSIIPEKCIGCTLCSKYCSANAITGEKKQPHIIDNKKCTRCGTCINTCRLNAIIVQ